MKTIITIWICWLPIPLYAQEKPGRVYYNNGWAIHEGQQFTVKNGDTIELEELEWRHKNGITNVIGTFTLRDSSFEMNMRKAIASGILKRPKNAKKTSAIRKTPPTPAAKTGPMIELSFRLPEGIHSATMSILDSSGKTVETFHVTDHFSAILVDPSELAPGKYTYQLHSSDEAFSTAEFTVPSNDSL